MTAEQMMKTEMAKGPTPKRKKLAIAGGALGVAVLVAGGIFGVQAANAYRADIEQMQTSAQEYYEAAAHQNELAAQAAADAAESAQAADEAASAAAAEEEAAAAALAAQQAAEAAEGPSYGNYPSGTAVPFIPSNDPENAAGGEYDVSACASNSATTVNGVPRCD